MKDKVKIDIKGSVDDAVHEVVSEAVGMTIVTLAALVILLCLFAPLLAPLFKSSLEKHYDTDHIFENNAKVRVAYRKVKIALWVFAAVAWILFLWLLISLSK